jgi:hypothetical protein
MTVVGFSILGLSSCKDQFDSLALFTLSYTQDMTIESNTIIQLPIDIVTPPIESNSETEFKNENTRKDLVKSIFIESLTVEIINPSSADFSFLENIALYISAEGLEKKKIAWKEPVPESNSNVLHPDITTEDLQAYIKADKFKLELNATTDEIISQDHDIRVFSEFKVTASLIN